MLITICSGAFLSNFTIGSVNIALPGLALSFGVSLIYMQWAVIGYLLSLTILLPLMGKLANHYGMRRVHNLGYLAFAATSIIVACAASAQMLIVARLLQGAAASMYQATNIGLISRHFPNTQRGKAMGWVSLAVALGAVCGPLVGGALVQWLSWQWLFILPALIMAGAVVLANRAIPFEDGQHPDKIDVIGAMWFTVALSAFITALAQGYVWG